MATAPRLRSGITEWTCRRSADGDGSAQPETMSVCRMPAAAGAPDRAWRRRRHGGQSDRVHHPFHRHLDAGHAVRHAAAAADRPRRSRPIPAHAGAVRFFYASQHFVTYIWLDQFFDLAHIGKDIVKRPFITVGFAAFALLILLAATSSHAMMRRLGRHWQQLHRLIYPVAVLGVIHYWWLVKKDLTQPLIFGAVLALLLAMRLPWGVSFLSAVRGRLAAAPE